MLMRKWQLFCWESELSKLQPSTLIWISSYCCCTMYWPVCSRTGLICFIVWFLLPQVVHEYGKSGKTSQVIWSRLIPHSDFGFWSTTKATTTLKNRPWRTILDTTPMFMSVVAVIVKAHEHGHWKKHGHGHGHAAWTWTRTCQSWYNHLRFKYICMYINMNMYKVREQLHVRIHVQLHLHVYVHVYVHVNVQCTCTWTYTCMCTCKRTCACKRDRECERGHWHRHGP
jgi:hypothetical protein